ncbi:MAG: transcriptional regulator PpsR [Rhodobacteraceae bacterium]|nr:MAG: transcriptional regulator PpsR [Paracoccaceae bacterium]
MSPFRDPETAIGDLTAQTASAALVAAADVALALDAAGVIVDVAHNGLELARDGVAAWIGKPWIETVATDSRRKVEEMLAAVGGEAIPPPRQINHLTPKGGELPVSYVVVPVREGRFLALGREMRSFAALQHRLVEAQHATEREYARLRDAEMRYRLLFQMASEALLIVDAATRRIAEANPAAERVVGGGKRLVGRTFPYGFATDDAPDLERLAARARATGKAEAISVRLIDGTQLEVSAALFRQEASAFLLVRLGGALSGAGASEDVRAAAAILESAPEGYVATDAAGVIRHVNTAFLNLAQLATEEQALGESLDRFLGRPGVDMTVLISTLRESGSVRAFATSMRGEFGSVVDVEICAARTAEGERQLYGFLIRNVENRNGARREGGLPRSVEQLTELVGRVPLRDLVRETTDVIERLCIEAALELTGDNRASAAEMLGLSRQSLYVKLRRYGLGDLDGGEE